MATHRHVLDVRDALVEFGVRLMRCGGVSGWVEVMRGVLGGGSSFMKTNPVEVFFMKMNYFLFPFLTFSTNTFAGLKLGT